MYNISYEVFPLRSQKYRCRGQAGAFYWSSIIRASGFS